MTRANTEQAKYIPWFAKAGAARSIVPIARFVNDHIFALRRWLRMPFCILGCG